MSKMGDYMQDWLDVGGYDLGYSEHDLPDISDMYGVLLSNIKVWEYHGVTEKHYYTKGVKRG